MYQTLLENNLAELTSRLFELYGSRWDFYKIIDRREVIMKKASKERSGYLAALDEEAVKAAESESVKPWYLDEKTVGMMLYVDLFAGNLKGLIDKISYFKELGVNYVHLMPLFDCPKGENDGGYAISSYRKVQPRLGTIDDLKAVAEAFHKNGIRLVLDFVFNHTSDEHKWAKAAKKGDEKYRNFYYIYDDKGEVDSWNATLREIFPTVRRGSFTKLNEKEWVWTTFNSFQWDLNYSNPEVFLAMVEEMLFIANLGVDVLRLDALAFVWKEKVTVCESLPKAHTLIQAFQYVARIAAPSLQFKSEAIVHPDEVIKYIQPYECRLSYNPLQMALFWNTVATRDTDLLTLSLKKRWYIPAKCAWINYIRCHDDIGWTFSDEDAAWLGINGYNHRQFLNRFFTGRFNGSFASGEPFQLNPTTGDCRICGTMASLSGLEQAEKTNNADLRKMAVARMKMMYAAQLALPGVPLLYAGDERAVLNDYGYRKDKAKKDDSRWVHRIKTDWEKPFEYDSQREVFEFVKKAIALRKGEKMLGGNDIYFYDVQDNGVFAYRRGTIHVIANFTDRVAHFRNDAWAEYSTDMLSGKKVRNYDVLSLEPYEVLWLKEELQAQRA